MFNEMRLSVTYKNVFYHVYKINVMKASVKEYYNNYNKKEKPTKVACDSNSFES